MPKKRGQGEGSTVRLHACGLYYTHVSLGTKANGKRDRRTVYGKTKETVRAKADKLRTDHRQGKITAADTITFGEWIERWLEMKKPHISSTSHADYHDVLYRHVLTHRETPKSKPVPTRLSRMRLQAVKRSDFKALETMLTSRNLSVRTRGKTFQYIRAALEEAIELEIIVVNPARKITVKATQVEEQSRLTASEKALSDAEMWGFLDAAQGDPLYAVFYTLFSLGLRRGEALGLRWRDVDYKTGRISIVQQLKIEKGDDGKRYAVTGALKTRNSKRVLYASDDLLEVLRSRKLEQEEQRDILTTAWMDTGLVFTTALGTAINPNNVNRSIARICERSGIRHFSSHTGRHTVLTHARRDGVPLEVVSAIAGHARPSITADLYIHPTDDQKKAAVNSLAARRKAQVRGIA